MGKLSKKLVSIVTAVVVMSGIAFTSLPAIEAKAQTSVTTTTTATSNTDLDAAFKDQVESNSAENYGLTEKTKDGVILHAFCWSFNTIKENMKDIASAGYSTVQTSPANTINASHPNMKILGSDMKNGTDGMWWWHYQPTDWKIGNYQLGSREEFKEMCAEADKYGVKIIVDVLPNHTTPDLNLVSPDLKNAAGGQSNLYHAHGFEQIRDQPDGWANRLTCTTYMMEGLPDVNTENKGFQKYYMEYVNDIIACGGDGFRYDTAKHIGVPSDPKAPGVSENDFWPVATGKKSVDGVKLNDNGNLFIYGEVLQDRGIPYQEYASYINMTASAYGDTIRGAVQSKDFSTGRIGNWNHDTPDRMVTWVESHDTYYNEGKSRYLGDWNIKMAWAIIAARKQGTPLFFTRPANNNNGQSWAGDNVLGAKGDDLFKSPEVAAVNKFRNAVYDQPECLRNPNGNQQILQIDRGTKGTVIINLGGDTSINNETTMANGTYTDQVTGGTFTVSGGKISGQLKGGKVHVIYSPGPIILKPTVGISPEGGSFKGNSVQVTLKTTNSTSATYSIDDGAETAYTNGQTKLIGENTPVGGTVKVTLRAKDDNGNTAEDSYTFTKKDGTLKAGVYFNKPSDWGTPTVYIYDDSVTPTKNNGWPGVAMSDNGDGEYYYEIPSDYKNPKVIFATSGKQFPASQQPGHAYKAGTALTCDGANWTEEEITVPVVAGQISTSKTSPQNINTKVTISTEAATGGTGEKTYQFEVNSNVIQAYSSSKSVDWTPTESGVYTIKVTAKDSIGKTDSKIITYQIKKQETKTLSIDSFTPNIMSPQNLGTTIQLSSSTSGGSGTLQTRYSAYDGSKWTMIKNYSALTSASWKPTKAGNYQVWVDVKDQTGKVVSKMINYMISASELSINSFTADVASPQNVGTTVNLNSSTTGGNGTLQTRYSAYDGSKWTMIKNYSALTSASWKPTKAGNYQVWVDVKDQTGKVVSKMITYVIKVSDPLSISKVTTSKQSPQEAGTAITVSVAASSANGLALTYKYSVFAGADGWKSLGAGYTSSNSVVWTPSAAGEYILLLEVRDSAGNRKFEFVEYSIENTTNVVTNVNASNSLIKTSGNWTKSDSVCSTLDENASMSFNFKGTGIKINGLKGINNGTALVLIDGSMQEVDLYSNTSSVGEVFAKNDLNPNQVHNVTIFSFGLSNQNATGHTIAITSFDISEGNIQ